MVTKEIILDKLRFAIVEHVSDEVVRDVQSLDVMFDYMTQGWVVRATWAVPGKTTTEEIGAEWVPDGWWQAFKLEVVPGWVRRWLHRSRTRRIPTSLQTIKVFPGTWPPDWRHAHQIFAFLTDDE